MPLVDYVAVVLAREHDLPRPDYLKGDLDGQGEFELEAEEVPRPRAHSA